MRQSLDTHRLFVDETAERSFLDCMLIPSPSPIHVFTQEEMQTFICSRRKKKTKPTNIRPTRESRSVPFPSTDWFGLLCRFGPEPPRTPAGCTNSQSPIRMAQ